MDSTWRNLYAPQPSRTNGYHVRIFWDGEICIMSHPTYIKLYSCTCTEGIGNILHQGRGVGNFLYQGGRQYAPKGLRLMQIYLHQPPPKPSQSTSFLHVGFPFLRKKVPTRNLEQPGHLSTRNCSEIFLGSNQKINM